MWCSARRPRTSGRSARLGTEATAVGEELVQGVDVDVLRVRVRGEHVGHELPLAIDRVLLHPPAELRNRFPARTTALKRKHARADHCARYTFEAPQVPGDAHISSSVRSIFVSVSSAAMRAAAVCRWARTTRWRASENGGIGPHLLRLPSSARPRNLFAQRCGVYRDLTEIAFTCAPCHRRCCGEATQQQTNLRRLRQGLRRQPA